MELTWKSKIKLREEHERKWWIITTVNLTAAVVETETELHGLDAPPFTRKEITIKMALVSELL